MKYSVMFHHFHDDDIFSKSKGSGSISKIDFHSIIDYIDQNFNLISPDEYTTKVLNKSIVETDVCLTFDDGLKSQFSIIYHELEKRKLKAFFFIYSSAFSKKPPLLEFTRDFKLFSFDEVDDYYNLFFEKVKTNYQKEYSSFLYLYDNNYLSNYFFYTSNDRKYRFLIDVILNEKYYEIVLEMMQSKNYSISKRKDCLLMCTEDVKILHNSGHSIGLHSHSHPTNFQSLNYKDQFEEYSENYEFLNSLIDGKISSMSHPCGNYNNDTLKILKKLDIKIGFRDSLVPENIKSDLEIPREDHSNILKMLKLN